MSLFGSGSQRTISPKTVSHSARLNGGVPSFQKVYLVFPTLRHISWIYRGFYSQILLIISFLCRANKTCYLVLLFTPIGLRGSFLDFFFFNDFSTISKPTKKVKRQAGAFSGKAPACHFTFFLSALKSWKYQKKTWIAQLLGNPSFLLILSRFRSRLKK